VTDFAAEIQHFNIKAYPSEENAQAVNFISPVFQSQIYNWPTA